MKRDILVQYWDKEDNRPKTENVYGFEGSLSPWSMARELNDERSESDIKLQDCDILGWSVIED